MRKIEARYSSTSEHSPFNWVSVLSERSWGMFSIVASLFFSSREIKISGVFTHTCRSSNDAEYMNTVSMMSDFNGIKWQDVDNVWKNVDFNKPSIIFAPLSTPKDSYQLSRILNFQTDELPADMLVVTFFELGREYNQQFELVDQVVNCRSFRNNCVYTAYFYVRQRSIRDQGVKRKAYKVCSSAPSKRMATQGSLVDVSQDVNTPPERESRACMLSRMVQERQIIMNVMNSCFRFDLDGNLLVSWILSGRFTQSVKILGWYTITYNPLKSVMVNWIDQGDLESFQDNQWYASKVVNTFLELMSMLEIFPKETTILPSTYSITYDDEPIINSKSWGKCVQSKLIKGGIDRVIFSVCVKNLHYITVVVTLSSRYVEVWDCLRLLSNKKSYPLGYQPIIDVITTKLDEDLLRNNHHGRAWSRHIRNDIPRQRDAFNCGPLLLCQTIYILFNVTDVGAFPSPAELRIFWAALFLKIQYMLSEISICDAQNDHFGDDDASDSSKGGGGDGNNSHSAGGGGGGSSNNGDGDSDGGNGDGVDDEDDASGAGNGGDGGRNVTFQ